MKPRFIEQEAKSILNVRKTPDSWFWDKYSINPFNGCAFGCIYCDARSSKYRMPELFEKEISVKINAAELLDQRISRARKLLPDVVALSGVTDSYQPAERKYRITRQILEVLLRHKWPVHIITKSKLVLEDADLLEEIAQKTWCTVSFTVSTVNRDYARFLDKFAPDPMIRLETMAALRTAAPSVQTGITLMPVVPGLGDTREEMSRTVNFAVRYGAQYILPAVGLTLRDTQANWFLRHLEAQFPELLPEYLKIYQGKWDGNNYQGNYSPGRIYSEKRMKFLWESIQQAGIATAIPRFIPGDHRGWKYKIAERLFLDSRDPFIGDFEKNSLKSWGNYFQTLETRAYSSEILRNASMPEMIKQRLESIIENW